jgi:putative FmdB family regulatory protein
VDTDWTRVRFPTVPQNNKGKKDKMPVYVFMCSNCGVTQKVVAQINEQLKPPYCGLCELDMVRQFGVGAIKFNGAGWGKDAL